MLCDPSVIKTTIENLLCNTKYYFTTLLKSSSHVFNITSFKCFMFYRPFWVCKTEWGLAPEKHFWKGGSALTGRTWYLAEELGFECFVFRLNIRPVGAVVITLHVWFLRVESGQIWRWHCSLSWWTMEMLSIGFKAALINIPMWTVDSMTICDTNTRIITQICSSSDFYCLSQLFVWVFQPSSTLFAAAA